MPEGLKPAELQAYAEILGRAARVGDITRQGRDERLAEVLAALSARNPVLRRLQPEPANPDALQDTIVGIARDCNVDDIAWFNDSGGSGAIAARHAPAVIFPLRKDSSEFLRLQRKLLA